MSSDRKTLANLANTFHLQPTFAAPAVAPAVRQPPRVRRDQFVPYTESPTQPQQPREEPEAAPEPAPVVYHVSQPPGEAQTPTDPADPLYVYPRPSVWWAVVYSQRFWDAIELHNNSTTRAAIYKEVAPLRARYEAALVEQTQEKRRCVEAIKEIVSEMPKGVALDQIKFSPRADKLKRDVMASLKRQEMSMIMSDADATTLEIADTQIRTCDHYIASISGMAIRRSVLAKVQTSNMRGMIARAQATTAQLRVAAQNEDGLKDLREAEEEQAAFASGMGKKGSASPTTHEDQFMLMLQEALRAPPATREYAVAEQPRTVAPSASTIAAFKLPRAPSHNPALQPATPVVPRASRAEEDPMEER